MLDAGGDNGWPWAVLGLPSIKRRSKIATTVYSDLQQNWDHTRVKAGGKLDKIILHTADPCEQRDFDLVTSSDK